MPDASSPSPSLASPSSPHIEFLVETPAPPAPPKVFALFPSNGSNGGTGTRVELAPLWLRERAQDPNHLDPVSNQRIFDPHRLPVDLQLTQARKDSARQSLFLSFNDGYSGIFETREFLRDFDPHDGCPAPEVWDASLSPIPKADWQTLEKSENLKEALKRFLSRGFLILFNTPTEKESILQIARKFGYVRETNFGTYFEVYSRPEASDANDLAYTSRALLPHTDNPYRDPVPGVQMLHCLANETSGGLSTLVDSIAVANQVRREDPSGFQLLATIPLRYRWIDKNTDLVERKELITLDSRGEVTGIHYNSKLDFLPPLSPEKIVQYHSARKRLIELFQDPRFEIKFLLQKGELMMFDNNRVLHGRTAFDPQEGLRQLQGCYLDRDQPRSLYRTLNRGNGNR